VLSAMLTVSQLSKSFAGRALFDDVSLQVNRGDRIGLVGPNGLANQPCLRCSWVMSRPIRKEMGSCLNI
jgi:ABC-type branched-subunit amino acid transport system ATPase component